MCFSLPVACKRGQENGHISAAQGLRQPGSLYMAASTATDFAKDIDTALSLSEQAVEDPDAAQRLTDLIKKLQDYKACTRAQRTTQIANRKIPSTSV